MGFACIYGMSKENHNTNKGDKMSEGSKVICNGYAGTIIEVHKGVLLGMVSVRLRAGVVCVAANDNGLILV